MKSGTLTLLFTVSLFFCILTHSESNSQISLDNGMNIIASDSSFSMKFGLLLQPRFEILDSINNDDAQGSSTDANALLRRVRFRFEGFTGTPRLTYFFQLGVTNYDMESIKDADGEITGIIYDAYLDWEFIDRTKLRAGQAKLPGCLSRLMSFGGLNFLERSNAESQFNTYRDIGIQLLDEWNISDFTVREMFAFTHGEGVNQKSFLDGGYAYSGRVELYPFGLFSKSGEQYEMDKAKEKTPKFMLGAAVFFDDEAHRERGVLGKALYGTRDITSYFADFLFIYSGFAMQGEYYKRQAPNPITANGDGKQSYVYAGQGFGGQLSYMITDDMVLAFRYSFVKPDDEILKNTGNRTDYSFGFTKFIFGNKVKLQSDFSYFEQEFFEKETMKLFHFRINMILSI